MPALKKQFLLMGDDKVDISTENENLRNQIVDYDEKWFEKI